jgi:transcriptional regulator with XRE-family HTH domain
MILGLSQQKLAEQIGLTFQQVQKYERGANRIGASKLWELSNVMDVPVQFFFGEMPQSSIDAMWKITGAAPPGLQEEAPEPYGENPLARREVLELVRAYCRIPETSLRHRIFELTKTLAAATSPDPLDSEPQN